MFGLVCDSGKVDKMMPTLGFDPERDNDRLVASFSGGWQMRIGLGKILLQEPDLLLLVRARASARLGHGCSAFVRACSAPASLCSVLLRAQDEPTNHLDVEAIEWLEQYLKSVEARAHRVASAHRASS
jgi:ATPase subunit of ABC transporter with duplicated ATPase domains